MNGLVKQRLIDMSACRTAARTALDAGQADTARWAADKLAVLFFDLDTDPAHRWGERAKVRDGIAELRAAVRKAERAA